MNLLKKQLVKLITQNAPQSTNEHESQKLIMNLLNKHIVKLITQMHAVNPMYNELIE